MCYTSGTTGKPKGVAYSHRGVVLHTLAVSAPDAFGLSMRDCILPIVPMFHANAWGMPTTAVMAGAKTVFAGPHTDHESVLELLESEQVSMTSGVPTVWLPVVNAMKRESIIEIKSALNCHGRLGRSGSNDPDFDVGGIVIHAWADRYPGDHGI